MNIVRLAPRVAKLRSLSGLLSNEALSLPYYRNAGMQTWVDSMLREERISAAVIFSSVMAQYVRHVPQLRVLVDFVDVDSAKWTQYAPNHRWPMSWLYRREGERLLAFELMCIRDRSRDDRRRQVVFLGHDHNPRAVSTRMSRFTRCRC